MAENEKALTVVGQVNRMPVPMVANMEQLKADLVLCDHLVKGGLLPKTVTTSGAALAIILTGRERGIGPMQSFQIFFVVNGRITESADGMAGEVFSKNVGWIRPTKETDASCTVLGHRYDNGLEYEATWTLERAKKAGLLSKDNWVKYEKEMLKHRSTAEVCRTLFPDVVGNMCTPEEIINSEPEPAPVRLAGSTTDRVKALLGVVEVQSVQEPAQESEPFAPQAMAVNGEAVIPEPEPQETPTPIMTPTISPGRTVYIITHDQALVLKEKVDSLAIGKSFNIELKKMGIEKLTEATSEQYDKLMQFVADYEDTK